MGNKLMEKLCEKFVQHRDIFIIIFSNRQKNNQVMLVIRSLIMCDSPYKFKFSEYRAIIYV